MWNMCLVITLFLEVAHLLFLRFELFHQFKPNNHWICYLKLIICALILILPFLMEGSDTHSSSKIKITLALQEGTSGSKHHDATQNQRSTDQRNQECEAIPESGLNRTFGTHSGLGTQRLRSACLRPNISHKAAFLHKAKHADRIRDMSTVTEE